MIPVRRSSLSEAGRFLAENAMGRFPVEGIRYRNGWPGLAPYTFGPLIWGIVCALGVRISGRLSPNANRHGNTTTAITIAEKRAIQPTTRDMDSPTFTIEFQLHEDSEHCESLRTPYATDNTSAPG